MASLQQHELDGFREAAQSLKLYRRAEIADSGGVSLIEELYVDPLPNEHVLNTMLKASTTFLVGRKGTGKSTVFQRAQHELRKIPTIASAYVDIKTVFESSQVDPILLGKVTAIDYALPPQALERLLLHQAFLAAVIGAIRDELHGRIQKSMWQKVKNALGGTLNDLFESLDELLEEADSEQFISVLGTMVTAATDRTKDESTSSKVSSGKVTLGKSPQLEGGVEASRSSMYSSEDERQYAEILMRVFNIKEYILRLKALLETVGIKHLYIFVDDFSELPLDAMRIVVDTILAPLNNWSDELIKFKVAGYPGRLYFGEIDKTKIDEINLDLYSLYGTSDIAGMEEKAVDFTRRLILRRLTHFGGTAAMESLETSGSVDLWRQLFYASMANPRNLGYLLFFMYESNLIYDRPINARALRDAARRYYEEKIEAYFGMNRFLQESFEERSSIFSLKELLEEIVHRARDLRGGQATSQLMQGLRGRPPTSHFHVAAELESLVSSLELNFFLTKYYVQSDRDGRKVNVYALNYGLCEKNTIGFGRPSGKREYRLYYVERLFDYSPILQEYLRTNQEIKCDSCGAHYEHEQLDSLVLFDMLCPKCKEGTCSVTNLSRKYEATLREIDDSLLLPRVELGILHTLGTESVPLSPGRIAGELDCSYQLVGKRAKFLSDRGLVHRGKSDSGRRQLSATARAKSIYLSELPAENDPTEDDTV